MKYVSTEQGQVSSEEHIEEISEVDVVGAKVTKCDPQSHSP